MALATALPATSAAQVAPINQGPNPSVNEGETVELTVALSQAPTSDVDIALSTASSEFTFTPSALRFTSADWDVPKAITIEGTIDNTIDGTTTSALSFLLSSADTNFGGMTHQALVMVADIDAADVTINPGTGLAVRAGSELVVRVGPATRPQIGTGIALSVSLVANSSVLRLSPTVEPAMLSFTDSDWAAKAVTVKMPEPAGDVEIPGGLAMTLSVFLDSGATSEPDYQSAMPATHAEIAVLGQSLGDQGIARIKTAFEIVDAASAQFAADAIGDILANEPHNAPGKSLKMHLGGWNEANDAQLFVSARTFSLSGETTHDGIATAPGGASTSVLAGAGFRNANGLSYGMALSSTNAQVDYRNGDISRVDREMLTLHPYVGYELQDDVRLWLLAGIGTGTAEVFVGNDIEKADASLRSISGGIEADWVARDWDIKARALAFGVQSEVEAKGASRLNQLPLDTDLWRGRMDIQAARHVSLGKGNVVQPSGSLGIRFDKGDLVKTTALELGAGVETKLQDSLRGNVDVRLQVGGDGIKESSLGGSVAYDRGHDGQGLLLSAGQLNDDEPFDAKVGYGWGMRIAGQNGVLGASLQSNPGSKSPIGHIGFDSKKLDMDFKAGTKETSVHLHFVSGFGN